MKIKYMKEPVDIKALLTMHKITEPNLNFLIRTAVDNKFSIGDMDYTVIRDDPESKKKKTYKCSKGDVVETDLSTKELGFITGQSQTSVSYCTRKKKVWSYEGWVVEVE